MRSNPARSEALCDHEKIFGIHPRLFSKAGHSDLSTYSCMGIPGYPSSSACDHKRLDSLSVQVGSSLF